MSDFDAATMAAFRPAVSRAAIADVFQSKRCVCWAPSSQVTDAFAEVFAAMAAASPPVEPVSSGAVSDRGGETDRGETDHDSQQPEKSTSEAEREDPAVEPEPEPLAAAEFHDDSELVQVDRDRDFQVTVREQDNSEVEPGSDRLSEHEQHDPSVDLASDDEQITTSNPAAEQQTQPPVKREAEPTGVLADDPIHVSEEAGRRDRSGTTKQTPAIEPVDADRLARQDTRATSKTLQQSQAGELDSPNGTQDSTVETLEDEPIKRTRRAQRLAENREHHGESRPADAAESQHRSSPRSALASTESAGSNAQTAASQSVEPSSSKPAAARTVDSMAGALQGSPIKQASEPTRRSTTNSRTGLESISTAETRGNVAKRKPADQTHKQTGTDTTARVKLVQRVSRAFQHLGSDGGVIRLRLAPAELGSVRVEMQVTQRKIQARVVAETEAASSILREHLPDLRSRLESFGMQIEQIEIETESQERQAEFSWNRHEQEQRDQRHRQSQNSRQRAEPPTHTQTVTEPVERATHDPRRAAVAGVDIRL